MANEKALLDYFAKIETDVSGVIAAAVVDLESGMTLAAKTNRGDFDLAADRGGTNLAILRNSVNKHTQTLN